MATIRSIESKRALLEKTHEIFLNTKTDIANSGGDSCKIFESLSSAVKFGWELKQSFTTEQDKKVDQIIQIIAKSGIQSFKLCGAGGSGFIPVLAEPSELDNLSLKLSGYKFFQPKIDMEGIKQLL